MIKRFLILLFVLGSLYSCSIERYRCPIPSGEIVFLQRKGAEMAKPAFTVMIKGLDQNVYSSSKGTVKDIEIVNGRSAIYVSHRNLVFIYDNLSYCNVQKGNLVTKGQHLGKVGQTDSLHFSIIKGGTFIMPQKMLKCPTVEKYID